MASLLPQPKQLFQDNAWNPLVGGQIYTYAAGTLTPKDTFQDAALTVSNTNPVAVNARGEVVMYGSGLYRVIVKDAAGNTLYDQDNVDSNVGASALAAATGAALVGFDDTTIAGTFKSRVNRVVSSIAALRALDKTKYNQALATGYYAAGDGGGGHYYLYALTGGIAADNGGTDIGGSDDGWWKLAQTSTVTVKQFGAKGDGAADDTAAILACVNASNASTSLQRAAVVPPGTYNVTALVLPDLYDFNLHFDGATIKGAASTAQDAAIKLLNAYNVDVTGKLVLNINGNANYAAGAMVDAAPGGTIAPTTGIVTRVNWFGLSVYNARQAIRVGTANVDAQCSEITFIGAQQFNCPTGAYVAGSQTGVSFVGCNLVSEPNSSYSAEPQWALIMDGGFCTIVGGELLHAVSSSNAGVWMRPATSTTYSNPYPVLRLTGVHIEMACQLAIISNPDALSSPDSGLSELTLNACSGFVSAAPNALPFVDVEDGNYTGTVSVKQSKLYTPAGNTRTGANINCYGAATTVSVDRESFGRGFKNWMSGVTLGSLLHSQEEVFAASSLGGATYPTGATALKFVSKTTGTQYDRYGSAYDTTTGVFTVPAGGLKTLDVKANCSTPGLSGEIYVKLNGNIVCLGTIYNTEANVHARMRNLAAGDTVAVYLQPAASATFGSQASDNISFVASN